MRLAVVSTSGNTTAILEEMKRKDPSLQVVLHLGDTSDDFKATTLSRMTARRGTRGHLMEGQRWTGAAHSIIESDDFAEKAEEFIDQLHRTSDTVAHKSHPLRTMADYADYFHILLDVMAQRLEEERVEAVLFFNVPHLTYDFVLYQAAKAMGLPTVIVTQSLFPDRYLSLRDVANLGDLEIDPEAVPYEIPKGSKPDLFYMAGIKQEREEGGRISAKAVAQLLTFLALKRPLKALNPVYVWRLVAHMKRVYGQMPKWRDPFAKFFHEDALAYFDHLATFEDQELDLSGDFIYVPLQLQPEMTTSALGGRFRDQAYAIERLARILPDGVRILVKENPKQGGYMRGPMFFHRLTRIPSVTFLPSWANTHALTDGARFVATITGTVGWEAIRQGKPVLVFGKAWYRKFEGVVEWRDDLTYEEIIGTTIDHAKVEQSAGTLLARAHQGVVDRHYQKLVEGYDDAANNTRVAQNILGLLKGEVASTFG